MNDPVLIKKVKMAILDDLWANPNGRVHNTGLTSDLREFLTTHVPEVEIIKQGKKELVRLKKEV